MDGEARRTRRQAHRPELRLAAAARLGLAALLAACASVGDPPGGPPDTTPPTVTRVSPDSGSVAPPPSEADIYFDEVISERVAAPRPDISGAVLLSPVKGNVDVRWHRDRISVRPHDGFEPGRVYHLQLLPVLSDLRQNRMRRGHLWVFSTGPAIPTASIDGAVVDWAGNRPAPNALIEALLLPDSLPYRTLADSAGGFALAEMPPGDYLVYGVLDQNNDRRRGPREAYDTARVHLADSASVELYAFAHDTTGPRLRTLEIADSVTLRATLDRPLDPAQHLDTGAVRFALATDSTAFLPVLAVWTQTEADSARAAAAARRAAADSAELRRQADSAGVRPPTDTARGRVPADTGRAARAERPREARPAAPPPLAVTPGPGGATGRGATPRDSTRAMKMLARRPAPSPVRLLRLAAPLVEGSRYILWIRGARDLSGVAADVRGQLAVPVPRAPRGARTPAAGDSLRQRADTTAPPAAAADSTRPPAAARPDTSRAALPPRRDSAPPPAPPPSPPSRGPRGRSP